MLQRKPYTCGNHNTHFKFHPRCRKLCLTHLMFADDLLMFCKADPYSIHQIKGALNTFSKCAHLYINLYKSQMVLGGCFRSVYNLCLQAVGLPESHFPLKYLGVPITFSKLLKLECCGLVDKVIAKVHTWASKNLSYAGRTQLINSALFGMFNY